MLLKTLLTALDRLGVAVITCVAMRTSITAYSTVVTPFYCLRLASDVWRMVPFSIVPSNFIPISSPLEALVIPALSGHPIN
jgi:hypothetical protein